MGPETGQEYPLRLGSSILDRQHDSQFCSLRFPFMPQSASRKEPARLDVAQDGGVGEWRPSQAYRCHQAADIQLLCCRWSCSWLIRTLIGQSCCSRGMLIQLKMIWSAWPSLMGTSGAWSSCRPLYTMPSKAGQDSAVWSCTPFGLVHNRRQSPDQALAAGSLCCCAKQARQGRPLQCAAVPL